MVIDLSITYYPIALVMGIILFLTWQFRPNPLRVLHLFILLPSLFSIGLLVWGTYCEKHGRKKAYQEIFLKFAAWGLALLGLYILWTFKAHWRFFLPIVVTELWFLYLTSYVTEMLISDNWH
ncbi:MAG: hypothetical protein K2X93_08865 [Candidatus Obscuribacterales bacterium]|nr:hypothetical protein [Candidatus Obscuribacterales bacterium]